MWTRDEIVAAISRLEVPAVELPEPDALAVEHRTECTFAAPGHGPLWQRVLESEGVHDANAWKRMAAFVHEPTTLFVRDGQGLCAFRFERAVDIVAVINSCPGFEFYVADDRNRFMLAFNDHDVLIGCGAAAEWIRELRASEK